MARNAEVERDSQFFDVVNPASSAPQLRVSLDEKIILDGRTTAVDLGSVATGSVQPFKEFDVWNHGAGNLDISSITATGGFLVSNAPTVLAPNQKQKFRALMPTSQVGPAFGEIKISTNDPDNAAFTFNVSGKVTGASSGPSVVLSRSATAYSKVNNAYLLDRDISIVTPVGDSLDGASLNLDFRSGAIGNEKLIVVPEGNGPGQINWNGNSLTFGGVVIGTLSGGMSGVPLSIQLNANATNAIVNQVARSIAFESSFIQTTPRYIGLVFNDRQGRPSPLQLKTIVAGQTVPEVKPSLMISPATISMNESGGSLVATVTRNREIESPLTITLVSDDLSEVSVPSPQSMTLLLTATKYQLSERLQMD